MSLTIAQWIADAVNATEIAAYEIESDDDSAIFGDIVPCVSGTVVQS